MYSWSNISFYCEQIFGWQVAEISFNFKEMETVLYLMWDGVWSSTENEFCVKTGESFLANLWKTHFEAATFELKEVWRACLSE